MHTLRDIGEEYIAPRTLYHFRERVYRHVVEHGAKGDLIFDQFTTLTDHFFELAGVKTDEQRMDSTFVSPNIQKAGRLALAFNVLFHAVKRCPQELLPDSLQAIIIPLFKTTLLYKTKASGIQSRLENLMELGRQLAIEGTNSTLKRGQSMGKLQVRGIHKSRVVVGLKIIGRNFQQVLHCIKRQVQQAAKVLAGFDTPSLQGRSLTC